jgi:hypothetical protein
MIRQTEVPEGPLKALEQLASQYAPSDPSRIERIYNWHDYGAGLQSQITHVLGAYADYKLVTSTDWEELERQKKAAEAARLAARSEESRTNVVRHNILHLMSVLTKRLAGVGVSFSENNEKIMLHADDSYTEINIQYSKESKKLFTDIDEVGGNQEYIDDCTTLSGQLPPADQLKGYAAVLSWLGDE